MKDGSGLFVGETGVAANHRLRQRWRSLTPGCTSIGGLTHRVTSRMSRTGPPHRTQKISSRSGPGSAHKVVWGESGDAHGAFSRACSDNLVKRSSRPKL